jgi:cellular nucleic acid-binding protein
MDSRKKALRQRGWSIQSEGTTQSSVHTAEVDAEEQHSHEEKVNLLQSIPASHSLLTKDGDDDSDDGEAKQISKQQPLKKDAESDMDQSDGDDDKAKTPIASNKLKRSLTDDDNDNDEKEDDDEQDEEPAQKKQKQAHILTLARSRLSKWAARLFDPDRPKGLIETPKVIPLNDEFLKDFGKRTQEHDKAMGVHLEIDHAITEEHQDDNDNGAPPAVAAGSAKSKASSVAGRKVKINNLAFSTSEATLKKACLKFGTLESVILLMNPDRKNMNTGRAFVTFDTEDGADACKEGLTKLDGRSVRITAAGDRPSGGGTTPSKSNSRYWVEDISTKCFRCGKVGHMEMSCPNPPLAKPCPFCAKLDHDIRDCPIKAICFNCGVPGHISRDCRQPRGMPPRRICSLCFQSGHSKYQCRRGSSAADNAVTRQALCMVCGETGHFLCQQMKWFFGQEGVTCCNCGRAGHIGAECDRPNFEACMRNDELAGQEVARASTYAEGEAALDPGRNQNNSNINNDLRGRQPGRDDPRGRGRDMERGRRQTQFEADRLRAHSMPPQRGRGGNGGGRSSSPPPNRGNGNNSNNNNDPRGRSPGRDDRGRGGRGGGGGGRGGGDLTITNDNQNNSRGYSVTVVPNNSKSDNTAKSKKADNSNKKANNNNNNKGKNPSPKNDNNANNNSNKKGKKTSPKNSQGNKKTPPKGSNSNPPPKAGKRKR